MITLKDVLYLLDLSHAELAKKIDKPTAFVKNHRDKQLSQLDGYILERIALLFNVTVDELLKRQIKFEK